MQINLDFPYNLELKKKKWNEKKILTDKVSVSSKKKKTHTVFH